MNTKLIILGILIVLFSGTTLADSFDGGEPTVSLNCNDGNCSIFHNLTYESSGDGLVDLNGLGTLGFALQGTVNETSYFFKSWETSWNWDILNNSDSNVSIKGTTNWNNFYWLQRWNFIAGEPVKLVHAIKNNTGQQVSNAKFYYVFAIDEAVIDSIKFRDSNSIVYHTPLENNVLINNPTPEQMDAFFNISNKFLFNFEDLIVDGFDFSLFFIGNLYDLHEDLPNQYGLVIGATKGTGTINAGQTIVLDPIFQDDFTGTNGNPPNSNNWQVLVSGTGTAEIQSNTLQLFAGTTGTQAGAVRMLNGSGASYDINFLDLSSMTARLTAPIVNSGELLFGLSEDDDANCLKIFGPWKQGETDANSMFISTTEDNGGTINFYFGTTNPLGVPIFTETGIGAFPHTYSLDINKINASDFNISVYLDETIKYSTVLANIGEGFENRRFWICNQYANNNTVSVDDFGYFDTNNPVVNSNFSFDTNYLDAEQGISSVNWFFENTTTFIDLTETARYWMEDDVNVGTDFNLLRNYNTIGDHTICLQTYTTSDFGDLNSLICQDINVLSYPQDVNFTWKPIFPGVNISTDFNGIFKAGIDDWFWQKDGVYWDNDINTYTTFASIGDVNVCLTANDFDDLNKVKCYDITVGGALHIQFVDENVGSGIKASVLIDSNNYSSSVDANGLLSINLGGWSSKVYTLQAWDSTRQIRTWLLDLNQYSVIDYNFTLLDTNKGQTIDFLMKDNNGTVLSDANVSFYISNTKFAGINKTNSSGEISFFLNGNDTNYFYTIQTATEILTFNQTLLNIKTPLDEETQAISLIPFNVKVSGIGGRQFTASSFDINFLVLPNIVGYYIVNVDFNADFFARDYAISVSGNPSLVEVQPYLASILEGYLVWFYVYDVSGIPFPKVLVKSKKSIPGIGTVEIESKETDATGISVMSFDSLDTYTLEFYYEGDLILSKTFVPSLVSYYVYLNVGVPDSSSLVDYAISSGISVDFYPKGNSILTPASPYDVWEVIAFGSDNIVITEINIRILKDNNVVYDANYTWIPGATTATLTQTIIEDGNKAIGVLYITLTITTNQGVLVRKMTYMVIFGEFQPYVFWLWLPNVKGEIGEFGALLIALFVAIFVCGGLAGTFGIRDTTPLGIIFCAILAAFTMIGWLNVFIFMMCCVFSGAIIIISRRELS